MTTHLERLRELGRAGADGRSWQGGCAHVRRERTGGRDAAVKVFPLELRQAYDRAVAALSIPAVMASSRFSQMLDHDDRTRTLVCEFVEGERLDSLMPLSPHEAARALAGVLDGLATLLSVGLFDGDMNPTNMIVRAGHVVLIDQCAAGRACMDPAPTRAIALFTLDTLLGGDKTGHRDTLLGGDKTGHRDLIDRIAPDLAAAVPLDLPNPHGPRAAERALRAYGATSSEGRQFT